MQWILPLYGSILPAKTVKRFIGFFVIGKATAQNAPLGFDSMTQPLFKVAGLFPGLRHQCHHASTMVHDMQQLLMGADLAVGHIQKISFTGNLAQSIPGLDVQGIIGAIAGIGFIVDGERTICADREVVDNLLQIRARIFAVALGKVISGKYSPRTRRIRRQSYGIKVSMRTPIFRHYCTLVRLLCSVNPEEFAFFQLPDTLVAVSCMDINVQIYSPYQAEDQASDECQQTNRVM